MGDMTMAMPPKGAADLVLLLVDVVDHDDRHDAAECRADDPDLRHGQPRRRARAQPYVPTALFAAGYLLAWVGFSIAATLAQWGARERGAALADGDVGDQPAAGRRAVPRRRPLPAHAAEARLPASPAARPSTSSSTAGATAPAGALRMGAAHGLYCLGCCWVLMALLFVFGAMNLVWVAVLAVAVLVEKLLPFGEWTARSAACC